MQTKILCSLCILIFSAGAYAQQHFYTSSNIRMKKTGNETSFTVSVVADQSSPAFNLYIFNPEQKRIDLRISHRVNGTVIDTVVSGMEFRQRYNFEQAEDGQYLIATSSGKERIFKTVRINTVTTRNIILIE